jgi:DNA-binding MltR family transcriptional regulator
VSRPSSSAALKKLSRQKLDLDRLPAVLHEINSGTDRVVAIVYSALVDDAIRGVVRARMQHLTPTEEAKLFEGTGPLSTFSARTMIAYAMSIIDKDERDDLDRIREIRNAFAHDFVSLSFEQKEVADVCRLLKAPKKWAEHFDINGTKPKFLFNITCMSI